MQCLDLRPTLCFFYPSPEFGPHWKKPSCSRWWQLCAEIVTDQGQAFADDVFAGSSMATQMVASAVQTLSHYAVHVHVACFVIFVSDFSLAAAVYPLGSLLYALVAMPRAAYWHALLMYTEALLLLQYIYQVAFRVGCLELDSDWLHFAHGAGLHSSVVRGHASFNLLSCC
jgi:hypothetical protein